MIYGGWEPVLLNRFEGRGEIDNAYVVGFLEEEVFEIAGLFFEISA